MVMARTPSTLPVLASGPKLMEPAQRRAAEGTGHAAQLPAFGAALAVEVAHADAGLRAAHAGLDPQQRVVGRQVEDDAAVQRHALPVVAGAAATHGDGQARRRAGADHRDDFRFGLRPHHGIGAQALQLPLQDRAEPVEILRQALDAAISNPFQRGQVGHHAARGLGHQRGIETAHECSSM